MKISLQHRPPHKADWTFLILFYGPIALLTLFVIVATIVS